MPPISSQRGNDKLGSSGVANNLGLNSSSFLGLKAQLESQKSSSLSKEDPSGSHQKQKESPLDQGQVYQQLLERKEDVKYGSGGGGGSSRLPSYLLPKQHGSRESKRMSGEKFGGSSSMVGKNIATSDWASTPSAQLDEARRSLQRKAEIYEKLKKGMYAGISDKALEENGLIDWNRKIAQGREDDIESDAEDGSDQDSGEGRGSVHPYEDPIVEYVDDLGRTRKARRSEVPREFLTQGLESQDVQEEDGGVAIYGPSTSFPVYRRPSPIPAAVGGVEQHFNADWEVRHRGAGFYKFSADEAKRKEEFEELNKLRTETEKKRRGEGELGIGEKEEEEYPGTSVEEGDEGSNQVQISNREGERRRRRPKTATEKRKDRRREEIEARRSMILGEQGAIEWKRRLEEDRLGEFLGEIQKQAGSFVGA